MARKKPRAHGRHPKEKLRRDAAHPDAADSGQRIFGIAILVWIAIALALGINAAMREVLYLPVLGYRGGRFLATLGAIGIVFSLAYVFVRARSDVAHRQWVRVGLLWAGLTLVFEILFGVIFLGRRGEDLLTGYDLGAGELWILVVISALVAPILWSRRLYRRSNAMLWFKP
jgi:hypothetical protein